MMDDNFKHIPIWIRDEDQLTLTTPEGEAAIEEILKYMSIPDAENMWTKFFELPKSIYIEHYMAFIDTYIKSHHVKPDICYGLATSLIHEISSNNSFKFCLIVLNHVDAGLLVYDDWCSLIKVAKQSELKKYITRYVENHSEQIIDLLNGDLAIIRDVTLRLCALVYDDICVELYEEFLDCIEEKVKQHNEKGKFLDEAQLMGLDVRELRLKAAKSNPELYKDLLEEIVENTPTPECESLAYEFFHHKERKYHDMAVRILERWQAHGYVVDETKILNS